MGILWEIRLTFGQGKRLRTPRMKLVMFLKQEETQDYCYGNQLVNAFKYILKAFLTIHKYCTQNTYTVYF